MTTEKLHLCAQRLTETGVTAFCPTLISLDKSEYESLIPLFKPSDGRITGGASVLGLHLEGPFFSRKKAGAHPLKNIRTPEEISPLEMYGGSKNLETVRIITSAPELPCSSLLMKTCLDVPFKSIGKRVMSMGHSSAKLADSERGVANGATMITHLFNAMAGYV